MNNTKTLQYKGFINTPPLWLESYVENISQLNLNFEALDLDSTELFNEIRLGKRVEQFLNFQINKTINCKILAENIQIKIQKQTIGELDAIALIDSIPVHIETVYKFYLYDDNIVSDTEIDKWIGPNRKDTLSYKLNKLKEKQLPLLYHTSTTDLLCKLDLDILKIKQQVCFKAQLFLPFKYVYTDIKPLNKNAVSGFYLNFKRLNVLDAYKFYIPKKLDWLTLPHKNVEWVDLENVKQKIENYIIEQRAPMVWLKDKNEHYSKCFITFW